MLRDKSILVGTRKSPLALVQTGAVVEALKRVFPDRHFRIVTIETAGDRAKDWTRTSDEVGIFVKEIEEALIGQRIDMAVHSLKDMPSDLGDGLELGAVCERAHSADALLANRQIKFDDLLPGSGVGTSSIRRRAQILFLRRDLAVKELRGNVDTRIKKLQSGEADAIIIAAAGVIRLGLERFVAELMPVDRMLPAACQGAVAVEIRGGDLKLRAMLEKIDHPPTRICTAAERSFLRTLGSGCHVPVAALGSIERGRLTLTGEVLSPSGEKSLKKSLTADATPESAEALGRSLAETLLELDGDWVRSVLNGKQR